MCFATQWPVMYVQSLFTYINKHDIWTSFLTFPIEHWLCCSNTGFTHHVQTVAENFSQSGFFRVGTLKGRGEKRSGSWKSTKNNNNKVHIYRNQLSPLRFLPGLLRFAPTNCPWVSKDGFLSAICDRSFSILRQVIGLYIINIAVIRFQLPEKAL